MLRSSLFFVFINFLIYGSEVPDFQDFSNTKGAVFFLSTARSGSNLISGSLSGITRKPISWIYWKKEVFDPYSERRNHPSYNRLGLPLCSDTPLLYRTHYQFEELRQVPSHLNKLIFVTRNPKELLFRSVLLKSPGSQTPSEEFVKDFLHSYLEPFKIYDSWFPENRVIVFYEDFIREGDEILLDLLQFMGEETAYLDDFMEKKQEYLNRLLISYQKYQGHNLGGTSSRDGPKAIYYSKEANPETLAYIDELIQRTAPEIWERYLKRFAPDTLE